MKIQQFEDKNLSHYSYAILSESKKQMVLIDPSRNPDQYYKFADENDALIIGVIETHPHADFVSSHLEIHQQTGAKIYGSRFTKAGFPHVVFDEGDCIEFERIKLNAINTPGHSPDSISVVLEYDGKNKVVFTGDTLFVGDCGRPDLRESGGAKEALREELAKKMYSSLRDKLMKLGDDVLVYPAHGAGTLCGKALSEASRSTIGAEKMGNWSLQKMSQEEFVKELLSDLPFIPAYFSFNVELNKKGAPAFSVSVSNVHIADPVTDENSAGRLQKDLWVVDVRDDKEFKKGHLFHSVNIMEGNKFETWLGSIIKPHEEFYLTASTAEQLQRMIERTAAIGYEQQIREAFIIDYVQQKNELFNKGEFKAHQNNYTIVDVRNSSEVNEHKIFSSSINIPLAELRNRIEEIPTNKPIVVHCAGGYRSAAASSIISSELNVRSDVYDIGEAIKEFQ
ncbi:rhodanese-like domain-containing protein [Pedobacter sp. P351]|uniref:MBL fold metallo-hydrolase n=1 Tax=Pedobacter superstes TaxID=3133441 RepID=UPI0030AFB812